MARLLLTGLLLAALALPAAAHAAGNVTPSPAPAAAAAAATAPTRDGSTPEQFVAIPTVTMRELPVGGARTLAGARPATATGRAPHIFNLVGVHWRGNGTVSLRTRGTDGRWSAWRPAAPEDEDRPDRGTQEAREATGWEIGSPWWTGPSDRLEVRTSGKVTRVRAYYVASATDRRPIRRTTIASSPLMLSRSTWGANELRKKAPVIAPALRYAVIHHTAGSNRYTRAESAAIVKGIQAYHVSGNGWNDIGYNFLVDRFGQVFEGRSGGVTKPVVGAHAEGFNMGSVGIAVLGTYGGAGISKEATDAIVRLLAWRLDVAHVDPLATFSWTSGGNARFPRGIPVFLRTISGHRDTGFTDCPGDSLYRVLDTLAGRVATTGLPKIYDPAATGKTGGPVRFTARLSAYGAWTVTVADAAGATVATGKGTGLAVDWTWDATAAAPGRYTWKIEAGKSLPATGIVGQAAATPPATPTPGATTPGATTPAPTTPRPGVPVAPGLINGFALGATVLSPNGDGLDDTTTVTYTLRKGSFVSAFVLDQSGTGVAQQLFTEQRQSARRISFPWDPSGLADGRYRFVVVARLPSGEQATAGVDLLVDRSSAPFAVAPAAFSPNADGTADTTTVSFALATQSRVTLRVLAADGSEAALPFTGDLAPGRQQITWDGAGFSGRLPDGTYTAQLTVSNGITERVERQPLTIDTTPPVLTVVSGPELRFSLSEAAAVTVLVDGVPVTLTAGPGEFQAPAPATAPTSVGAVATDAAGNSSGTAAWP
jgi:hypothetical protein